MKFAVASDVHLEFGRLELFNDEDADVLILSGDICVAKDLRPRDDYELMGQNRSTMYHTFFQECCERFAHVVYVAGNHEHYHGDFPKTINRLRTTFDYLPNLHILDKETFTYKDVTFIGGTLWTDMNKEDPNTLYGIRGYMNDFQIVEDSSNPVYYRDNDGNSRTRSAALHPDTVVEDHKRMLKFIDMVTGTSDAVTKKFVVVGHHAPSRQSTHPRYKDDHMVNGGYSSELAEFILDRPQIKAWTHGHTHEPFDYMIGTTRIVCNPRGYINYEQRADDFKLHYVEV